MANPYVKGGLPAQAPFGPQYVFDLNTRMAPNAA